METINVVFLTTANFSNLYTLMKTDGLTGPMLADNKKGVDVWKGWTV